MTDLQVPLFHLVIKPASPGIASEAEMQRVVDCLGELFAAQGVEGRVVIQNVLWIGLVTELPEVIVISSDRGAIEAILEEQIGERTGLQDGDRFDTELFAYELKPVAALDLDPTGPLARC